MRKAKHTSDIPDAEETVPFESNFTSRKSVTFSEYDEYHEFGSSDEDYVECIDEISDIAFKNKI